MSETVVVQFFGICTHLDPLALRELPGRRVVLVNASQARIDEVPELKDRGIGPHVARLRIARRDITGPLPPADLPWMRLVEDDGEFLVWELNGVRMRVSNAIETVHRSLEALCIPQLALYIGGPSSVLPDLGPAAWAERPELTACAFDFPRSPLVGRSWNEAAVGVVTVELSGPPVLEIAAFQDGGQTSIPLAAGAHISLSNKDAGPAPGNDYDFLLHFLVLATFPPGATVPATGGGGGCPGLFSHNIPYNALSGPGCGNSTYP